MPRQESVIGEDKERPSSPATAGPLELSHEAAGRARAPLSTVGHVKDHFLAGSETFIYSLVSALRGYRSIVVDRHRQQNAALFPFSDHYSPAKRLGAVGGVLERASLRILRRSPYLEGVLRSQEVRLLHAHFGQTGALFVPVARRSGLPLVTSFYGTDVSIFVPHRAWRSRFERLWEYGSRMLVLGPRMADRLAAYGCPEEKMSVLPLSIDVRKFAVFERRPPPAGDPICILSAGRLVAVKGMDVLLRAAAVLRRRHPIRIWIAGDGPERSALERLSRTLDLEGVAYFLGWVPHTRMAEVMARAHMFVLASRTDRATEQTEGTPTVLLEAQASGLPVVSTRHGDIPSIVQHGRSGVLVPEDDPGALADAFDQLLSRPENWPSFCRAGRAYVEASHHVDVVADRLEQIYASCITGAWRP